jgi:hypothetical protein
MMSGGPEAILANHRNLMGIIYTFIYREKELLAAFDTLLDPAIAKTS